MGALRTGSILLVCAVAVVSNALVSSRLNTDFWQVIYTDDFG